MSVGQAIYLALSLGLIFWSVKLLRETWRQTGTGVIKNSDALSTVLGIIAGVLIRVGFGLEGVGVRGGASIGGLMSFGFLFLSPLVIGFVRVYFDKFQSSVWASVSSPVAPVAYCFLLAGVIGFEGLICLVMAAPVWLVLAAIGGLTGLISKKFFQPKSTPLVVGLFLLPFISGWIEQRIQPPLSLEQTTNSIVIQASPEVVWNEIRSVPEISQAELPQSLAYSIGFPRPLAATLEGQGVGAVRHATFAGGLEFTETITEWLPRQVLAFSIKANTEHIPGTTLDQHVTVGGKFFDILSGRYSIELNPDNTVTLVLTSQHRLSTEFNFVARLWSQAIMSSIQKSILSVIRARAER